MISRNYLFNITIFILLASLWGLSFIFLRIASVHFDIISLASGRIFFACIFLLPFFLFSRLPSQIFFLFCLGFLNSALPFTLTSFSAMHLPASYLATINSLVPLITVCARRAFFGTIPTKKTGFAVLIGTLGVVMVVGLGPLRFNEVIFISCLASIGAAICYSLSGIFVIHYFKNKSLIALSFMSLISAFTILAPINYFMLDDIPVFPVEGLYSLAILGVFCTGFAYLLYFQVLKFFGPTASSSVTYSVPMFGTLWGVLFLGEAITWQIGIGCAVILIASIVIFQGESRA